LVSAVIRAASDAEIRLYQRIDPATPCSAAPAVRLQTNNSRRRGAARPYSDRFVVEEDHALWGCDLEKSVQDVGVVSAAVDARARDDIRELGFTRRGLPVDLDVARALAELAHAAWSLPRDQYYEAGTRYRSLNRLRARIVKDGVEIEPCDDSQPYVQLKKYNTALGGQQRKYSPLPREIADSAGVRKVIGHHLMYLPLSEVGKSYSVNMHVIRFAATPSRPCDTSPAGLHKDGEKYLATHLLARCGAQGGEVVITDNDKRERDRFTMREAGECYVFDDDRIWHMLTPVETSEGNQFAYRDTVTFDLLPDGWEASS
jgi:hypothetical protein